MTEKKKDSEKQKVVSTNVINQDGICIELLEIWGEVEKWYGDIRQEETGEQFLKRIQSCYKITRL